jgi:hypothetical protein
VWKKFVSGKSGDAEKHGMRAGKWQSGGGILCSDK